MHTRTQNQNKQTHTGFGIHKFKDDLCALKGHESKETPKNSCLTLSNDVEEEEEKEIKLYNMPAFCTIPGFI